MAAALPASEIGGVPATRDQSADVQQISGPVREYGIDGLKDLSRRPCPTGHCAESGAVCAGATVLEQALTMAQSIQWPLQTRRIHRRRSVHDLADPDPPRVDHAATADGRSRHQTVSPSADPMTVAVDWTNGRWPTGVRWPSRATLDDHARYLCGLHAAAGMHGSWCGVSLAATPRCAIPSMSLSTNRNHVTTPVPRP